MRKILPVLISVSLAITFLGCQHLDCAKYKNGKFYIFNRKTNTKYIIERKDSTQTEIVVRTDTIVHEIVKWISPCEYEIVEGLKYSDSSLKFVQQVPLHVEIKNSNKDFYTFRATMTTIQKKVIAYNDTMWIYK